MARVCAEPGCPTLAVDNRHCDKHKPEPWKGSIKRSSRPWDRKRKRILRRDRHVCQPCKRGGKVTKAKQVDHIIPLAQGGSDEDENLQAICTDCHKAKSQREANAFRLPIHLFD